MPGPGFLGLPSTMGGLTCSPQLGKARHPLFSHPLFLFRRWWGLLLAPRAFTKLTWWFDLCNEKSWDGSWKGRTKKTASKAANK